MARAFIPLLTCLAVVLLSAAGTASEGIDGEVLRVDLKKQCLWLDWGQRYRENRVLDREVEVLGARDGKAGKAG